MVRSSSARSPAPGATVPPATRQGVALLASKVTPPQPAHATVLRPRLVSQLSRAVQRSPLTLLSGPAGSGKTVLATSWRQAQQDGRPVAWLTLDDYDDDPATFWNYVVGALAAAGVPCTDLPSLVPGEAPPGWFVPQLAAHLAALPRTVVLVVDDADHVRDRAITNGLDLLVRHGGSRLRLVLCARADPLLPLHQYRLAGTVSEIRGDELAFTPEENHDLLTAMGVPVSPEVARALCTEAQGWAVGLRLAAAPLKQGASPEHLVTSLAHDDGSVAQYLFAEVLQRQPASVRRFLMRVSVTAECWPDLVDRLCGRPIGRRVLAGLARANAFVEEFPGAPEGFRIHPLFREMLQAQLAYDHPGEVAGLHRTCAAWYAEAGRSPEAVGHAVAAGDWDFATRVLIDDLLVMRLLAHRSDPALPGVQALPAQFPGPEAAVIRSAAALAGGHVPTPADLAAVATARGEGHRMMLRVSAALTCLVADAAAATAPSALLAEADAAGSLVAALPGEERREHRECAAVLSSVRALAALGTDAPDRQLLAGLRSAAAAAQTAASRSLRSRTVAHLAVLEALDGHLTRAAHLAEEAEALASDEGREEAEREPAAAAALAWVHLRRYSLTEAREWLVRARARTRDRDGGPSAAATTPPLLAVLQSQLFRLRHEYDAAEQCLGPHLRGPRLPRWVAEQVVAELVRLAVARGHVDEGLAILQDTTADEPWSRRLRDTVGLLSGAPAAPAPTEAEPPAVPAAAVESSVIRACQLLEAGRVPAAAEQLAAALELARPELLRWPFIDTPPQARRLLRTHPRLQEPAAWLSPSSTAQPRPDGQRRAARSEVAQVIQELSDREMEVLQHLAGMLSTAEIAATMFISVNTVRTHIRSILRKLAVSRRNQAVRRARERGLL
ncbi:LuxR C-terminal-related transcriptional regulator [Geodermatophilus sabuli]|uniref:LuxR family transcriptional regulator, maltose regulon positive regulatory protein n=1 Tax=Geodermatophilus sabuli TaxID=1564158 RepID=A0A285EDS9_9ACTN|nr:LuxR C-terminal-related transcriptional regulator [Geodermatophilus sabuli]MBB3084503.1 LuxR family maltose regulon positive regulatory protein [Geodermatophilus sabuli]SNX97302.1 LuxR family transcriptional regulator, maltose regulon positive regulatory protein [Geodermatophilus sabuli]